MGLSEAPVSARVLRLCALARSDWLSFQTHFCGNGAEVPSTWWGCVSQPSWLGVLLATCVVSLVLALIRLVWLWRKRRLSRMLEVGARDRTNFPELSMPIQKEFGPKHPEEHRTISTTSLERHVWDGSFLGAGGLGGGFQQGSPFAASSVEAPRGWGQRDPVLNWNRFKDDDEDLWRFDARQDNVYRQTLRMQTTESSTMTRCTTDSTLGPAPKVISNMDGVTLSSILKKGTVHTPIDSLASDLELGQMHALSSMTAKSAASDPGCSSRKSAGRMKASGNVRFRDNDSVFSISAYSVSTTDSDEVKTDGTDDEDWEVFKARMRAWSVEVLGKEEKAQVVRNPEKVSTNGVSSLGAVDEEDILTDLHMIEEAEAEDLSTTSVLEPGHEEEHEAASSASEEPLPVTKDISWDMLSSAVPSMNKDRAEDNKDIPLMTTDISWAVPTIAEPSADKDRAEDSKEERTDLVTRRPTADERRKMFVNSRQSASDNSGVEKNSSFATSSVAAEEAPVESVASGAGDELPIQWRLTVEELSCPTRSLDQSPEKSTAVPSLAETPGNFTRASSVDGSLDSLPPGAPLPSAGSFVSGRGSVNLDVFPPLLERQGSAWSVSSLVFNKEGEATQWLETLSGELRGDADFCQWLEDGKLLCKVANVIKPGIVGKVHKATKNKPYMKRDNINSFLKACMSLGVLEKDLFGVDDLVLGTNEANVWTCVCRLGAAVRLTAPDFHGPYIELPASMSPRPLSPRGRVKTVDSVVTGARGLGSFSYQSSHHLHV